MDPSLFGLNGNPFANRDDADAPCRAEDQVALTTELHAGLKAPHGITLLIGESGAGKTTFIREFLAQLPESFVVAYLPTAGPGLRHLLTETIEQLGGTVAPGAQEQGLIDTLRALAKARAEHDRATLIVIDDAHDLPAKTIERLGKLFGTDPAEPSRLHLTLVGRAELLDRMNAANDRSILKHLVQVCRMDPMGPEDAFRYIADRVQRVGGIVDRLFTEEALKKVVEECEGNPGRIDALCSAAMEKAVELGRSSVDADAVEAAGSATQSAAGDGDDVAKNDEPSTPTYFFSEDGGSENDGARPPETGIADKRALSAALPPAKQSSAGRRRLLLWALAGTAVLAAFALTLTERNQPAGIDLASQKSETKQAPAGTKPAKAERAERAAERAAVRATNDGVAPLAIPKLVAKRTDQPSPQREGAATSGTAASSAEPASGQTRPRFPAPAVPQATAPPPAPAAAAAPAPAQPAGAETSSPGATPAVASPAASAPEKAAPVAAKVSEAAQPRPAPEPTQSTGPATSPAAGPSVAAKTPAATTPAPPKPVAAAPGEPAATKAQPASAPVKPSPAAAPPIQPTRAAPPPAPTPKKVVAPPAPEVASAAAPAGGTRYTVQLGAFSSRANAEAVLSKARGLATDGRIVATTASGKTMFRVVSGSFASQSEANTHAAALKKKGYSTFVRSLD